MSQMWHVSNPVIFFTVKSLPTSLLCVWVLLCLVHVHLLRIDDLTDMRAFESALFVISAGTCYVSAAVLHYSLWSSLALWIFQSRHCLVTHELENSMVDILLPPMVLRSRDSYTISWLSQNISQQLKKTVQTNHSIDSSNNVKIYVSPESWGFFYPCVRLLVCTTAVLVSLAPRYSAVQSATFPCMAQTLILRHQLFPACPGSPRASLSEKMCFALWPCRKHARPLWLGSHAQKCNSLSSAESFWNTLIPFCSLVIYYLWVGSTAVQQTRSTRQCHLDWKEHKVDKSLSELSDSFVGKCNLFILFKYSTLSHSFIGWFIIHHSYFWDELLCLSVLHQSIASLMYLDSCLSHVALMNSIKWCCNTPRTPGYPSATPHPLFLFHSLPPTHNEWTSSCISSSASN